MLNSVLKLRLINLILGGQLHMLKEKWWKQQKGGGQCYVAADSSAAALGLANVGGVFVVLVVGLFIACTMAVFEYLWSKRQKKLKKLPPQRLVGGIFSLYNHKSFVINNQM